jgi:uncharacterized protein
MTMQDETRAAMGPGRRALLLASGTAAGLHLAGARAAAAGTPVALGPRIDAHTHFVPLKALAFMEAAEGRPFVLHRLFDQLPALTDISARMALLDRNAIDLQVLVPVPWIEGFPKVYADPALSAQAARMVNDELAGVIAAHPTRLRGVAMLPAANPTEMVAELRRAVTQLNFLGGYIAVGPTTRRMDDPEFEALYKTVVDLDATLWLHPSRGPTSTDYSNEKLSMWGEWNLVGWPYDTTSAMFMIVFSGVFDRYPTLRVLTHHHGAFLPLLAPRLNNLWQPDAGGEGMPTRISTPYIDHFRKFYCDTAASGFAPKDLELAVGFFGPEHVLFGTDAPFGPQDGQVFVQETLQSIDAMQVAPETRTALLSGNAKRILRLS